MKCRYLSIIIYLILLNFPANANSILAVVNNKIITSYDVNKYQLNKDKYFDNESKIKFLIDSEIFLYEAKKTETKVPEILLQINLENIAKSNNLSMDEFIKNPEFQDIKEKINNTLIIEIFKKNLIDTAQLSMDSNLDFDKNKFLEEWVKSTKENYHIEIYYKNSI